MKGATCKSRVKPQFRGRMADIRKLWALHTTDCEASDPDLGTFNDYGLSFDYVAPDTFKGQKRGYWRYQLSWGGPSDEFRFYCDESRKPVRIEYWFMDWYDGARRTLRGGKDFALLAEIFADFEDMGLLESTYNAACEE